MWMSRIREIWAADSLRGRFARGAVWSLIGALVSQGASLAASVLTARLLGREQFGEYGMLQSTVGMFGVFAGMGLGLTATKYVAELRGTDPDRAGRIVALSTAVAMITAAVAAVVLVAAAPWLASVTLSAPQLTTELRIAGGVLFLNALNGAQTGALAGFESFRAIARVNLIRGLLTFPLAAGGVWLWGLRGAVLALVATAGAGWLLNHAAIRQACRAHGVKVRWAGCWEDRGILWKFSLPAFLGGAMTSPAMWVASSILVHQPHGYAEMGVFSAANQWRTAVVFLPSLLSQPLLSMLSNVGAGNSARFKKLVRVNLLLTLGVSVAVAAPIVVCAPWIMQAYGRGFGAGRPVLVLLVLATVISATASVIGQAIASLDRMWWGFHLNAIWALVLLGSAVLLVPRFGAMGLAGAFLASYTVHAVTVSTYLRVQFSRHVGRG
ncbi:MAG: polysaccharide biosynthesis protein, partial [Candidatus Solibacter sp.]|nr:polysaccharide biosynthesis protein [Candidatus Solibacter sp.]